MIYEYELESTAIEKVRYNINTFDLEITFRHGGTYCYQQVPQSIFIELMHAESKGRYFGKRIKGHFRFYRLK